MVAGIFILVAIERMVAEARYERVYVINKRIIVLCVAVYRNWTSRYI